jgi:hypothetical protein
MLRYVICLLVLLSAGCQTCESPTFTRKPDTSDPWNTNYLIDADPESVSIADLSSRAIVLGEHYWDYSQVDGVLWPAWRTDPGLDNPDRWINGGDSGIYTGTALAAFAFEYGTVKSPEALERVAETLRGVYLLTHASGTPGVLQRNAAPISRGAEFGWPGEQWASRDQDFINQGPPLTDPYSGVPLGSYIYYSRATKDQLTGMVLGLCATWSILDPDDAPPGLQARVVPVRTLAKWISDAIYDHLKLHNWNIRDENGKNDTNADHVDLLLRAAILGLQVHTGNTALQEEYDKEFEKHIDLANVLAIGDRFNNFQQYYAHNLRASRSLSIWLLEGAGSDKGQKVASYIRTNLWKFVKGHKSAWFAFLRAATKPSDTEAIAEGIYSLKSLSLKPIRMWSSPYHGQEQKPNLAEVTLDCHRNAVVDPHLRKPEDYSTWQKEPWDVGSGEKWDKEGRGDSSGLDFLLAYWLARYTGSL